MKAFSGTQTKLALALAAVAMTASMGAQAVPMSNPVLSGVPNAVYLEGPAGTLTLQPSTAANVAAALSGGGNVELGKFASSPATTLSGDFAGTPVVLSGLVLADWTANSNWLTQQYITGAATSIGAPPLTLVQLAAATAAFLTLDILPGPGVMNPYQRVSDPNVSDVNLLNGAVVVGLDGFLDATPFLGALFNPFLIAAGEPPVPPGAQASEVVKVTYQGNTSYLYGFSATPTGYQTADGSYSGRYTVPLPATLWLMGIGLAALVAGRRR